MGLTSSTPSYDPEKDIPDLTGKVALVSGGNTGLGYYTVAHLVKHGAKVYMGARSESRATGAIMRLRAEGFLDGTAGEVVWLPLDVSTPASTALGAEVFLEREQRLDILVNNAGIQMDGFHLVDAKVPVISFISTNHLGTFVLTTTLMPLIKKTAAQPGSDVRVLMIRTTSNINQTQGPDKALGSVRHRNAVNVNWKNPEEWAFKEGGFLDSIRIYGTTKLANTLFAKQLQVKFNEEGIDALSILVDPGKASTDGVINVTRSFWLSRLILPLILAFGHFTSPLEGAHTGLFAATAPIVRKEKKRYGGAYLVPFGKIAVPSEAAQDPLAARDLWESSERLVSMM